MRRALTALLAAGVLAGCGAATTANGDAADPSARPSPPPLPPTEGFLPRGTEFDVVLTDTLDAEEARVGDRFTARIHTPLLTESGRPVLPEGTTITGLITGVDDSDHEGDPAYLRLNFIRLTLGEANHPFAAEIVSTDLGVRAGEDVKDAEKSAPVGAVAGAVIGAVIGGDLRTAIEGASLGAGAGSIIALGTRNTRLPAGTVLRLRTTVGISLTE